jgi:beta-lactamase regulating signal transducer with metallopeptidase domain
MSVVFIKILNMSIAAGWLIGAVLLLRLVLRKAPHWISCILWALVALRLVIPFSLESSFSIIPSNETFSVSSSDENASEIRSGIAVIDQNINKVFSPPDTQENDESMTEAGEIKYIDSNTFFSRFSLIGSIVWIAGVLGMLLWELISFLRIRKETMASVPIEGRVMACDEIASPFILGIIKPRIIVPSDLSGEDLGFALAHEKAHLKRLDHWWKPLGFLILSVYWFNPLCWAAYILFCRDIEYACDEKVIREMGGHQVKEYSRALLDLSLTRRRILAYPLAFGEMSVKQRIKKILNYKKPAFWVIVVSLIVCTAAALFFLTDPKVRSQGESSEDPIDQAIQLSIKLSQENPANPLMSARTPQRSEAVLTAMKTIPIDAFPEVWERCCTEAAYRAQKLTAMEQFLQISLEYGLYDPWAQEQWYLRFTEMKASLPERELTGEDRLRYGNLLLPLLEDRLRGGSLGEGEWTVLQAMIGQASLQFDFPEKSVATRKEALDWFSAHENLTEAIRRIIEKDYSWIP